MSVFFVPFFTIQKGGNNIMDGHKPIPIHDLRKANALENKDQWLKWRKEGCCIRDRHLRQHAERCHYSKGYKRYEI